MDNVTVTSVDLPPLTAGLVSQAAASGLGNHEIAVLPRHLRDGHLYFDDEDIESIKLARSIQLEARQVGNEGREYLHEYSAGWVCDVAIAIGENLAADSILLLARLVWLKARSAVSRGLAPGPTSSVPLRLQASRIVVNAEGSDTRSVAIEGPAGDVLRALAPTLAQLGVPAADGLEVPAPPDIEDADPDAELD